MSSVTAGAVALAGFATASPVWAGTTSTVALGACTDAATTANNLKAAFDALGDGDTLNITTDGVCVVDMSAYNMGAGANARLVNSTANTITVLGPSAAGHSVEIKSAAAADGALISVGSMYLGNVTLTGRASATQTLIWSSNTITLDTVVLRDNELGSSSSVAGAYSEGLVTMVNSTVSGNTSQGYGAIFAEGSIAVTNSVFEDNSVASDFYGYGGALYSNQDITITDSAFNNNSGTHDGGAVFAYQALTITGSSFDSNLSSTGSGGAARAGTNITINRSTFSNNAATAGVGGAFYVANGNAVIDNSTFFNNSALSDGLLNSYEGTKITNSTLWNNRSTATGNYFITNSGVMLFGSIVGDVDPGTHLISDSSFSDLGANLLTNASGLTLDITQNSHVVTPSALDMEALDLNTNYPSNSGATKTMKPGANSIAIDYYTVLSLTAVSVNTDEQSATDQRGVSRPINGAYDVGAVEVGPYSAPDCATTKLGTIQFTANSPRLSAKAKTKLRAYGDQLVAAGCADVKLDAYTSTANGASKATEHIRTKLAKARNSATKKYLNSYLTGKNVTVTFTTKTHNAHHPVASNSGPNRWKNRRVVVSMLSEADACVGSCLVG